MLAVLRDSSGVVVDPAADTRYKEVATRTFIENAGGMPSLVRAANGDLLFAYSTHWEPVPAGGVINLMRSGDEGATWTSPEPMILPKSQDWSTHFWSGLHLMPDNSLMLSYAQAWFTRRENVPPGEQDPAKIYDLNGPKDVEMYVVRSLDHGTSWGAPTQLASGLDWSYAMGKPLTVPDGSVLVPLWGPEPNGLASSASYLIRTTDNAQTWSDPELLAGGVVDFNEVSLGVAGTGDLIAIFRDGAYGPRRQFRQSVSTDNGYHWSTPELIDLFGKMPDILRTSTGELLMAVGSIDLMDGGLAFSAPPNSSFAGLFISDDDGATWTRDVMLTTSDLSRLIPFDAPVLMELANGHILAIALSVDTEYQNDPLLGWTRGMHYTIHELAPVGVPEPPAAGILCGGMVVVLAWTRSRKLLAGVE